MELILPKFGLFFWTVVIFLTLFIILRKAAWKPILKGLREREQGIADALAAADKAREELGALSAKNEELLKQAVAERNAIVKEANDYKAKVMAEARDAAHAESAKIVAEARAQIQADKMAAITEIKNLSGSLAVEIAEKILKKELADRNAQMAYAQRLLDNVNIN